MAKNNNRAVRPFELKDCALITLATGARAINLRELRDRVAEIEEKSLYYHFWENLLRPGFDDPEYRNDFGLWARRALHDAKLAEKLAMLDPLECRDLAELRQQLLDVIEDHLAERETVPWARREMEFHFLTSRVVVFDTGARLNTVDELSRRVARMSTGSIFYHFIDARRREPVAADDFTIWLAEFGEPTEELRAQLQLIDYYSWPLAELRQRLAQAFKDNLPRKEKR